MKGRIEIKKDGTVIGNLTTAQIMIEDGADFKGSIEIDRSGAEAADKNVSSRAAAGAGQKSIQAVPLLRLHRRKTSSDGEGVLCGRAIDDAAFIQIHTALHTRARNCLSLSVRLKDSKARAKRAQNVPRFLPPLTLLTALTVNRC